MEIRPLDNPVWDDHREVHFFEDHRAGLRAFIAIHSRGPLGIAGGGCRMRSYARDEDALTDVLRLSSAMSAKMLLGGVHAGGAKCVVVGDPVRDKTPELLAALARAIDTLHGRFVAGIDVGTSVADLQALARHTAYVERTSSDVDAGSETTALGVVAAMEAAAEQALGSGDLWGVRIAIQGVGKVGASVARALRRRGAVLTLADADDARAEALGRELGAEVISPAAVLTAPATIFAPCALEDVIHEVSLGQLQCRIVAGAANNQLARPELAERLQGRGILYVPDFVANLGGVLAGAYPHRCASPRGREALAEKVGEVTREVLGRAAAAGRTPQLAAQELVRERARALEAESGRLRQAAARAIVGRLWRRPGFARSVLDLRQALARARS